MLLLIGNVETRIVIGGKDNLLKDEAGKPLDLLEELRKYLRVKVPGSFYARRGRPGWDGYRYFIAGERFPTGFVPNVVTYAEELGAIVTLQDDRQNMPVFKPEGAPLELNGYELRDYQAALVDKAALDFRGLLWPRGIYDAATNAGKNLLTVALLRRMEDPQAVFLLHSSDIYDQAVEYFSTFFEVGQICSAAKGRKEQHLLKPFTIALVKTLYKRAADSMELRVWLGTRNTLVVDEAHHAGGTEFVQLIRWINAGARYFVSGTPLENTDPVKNMLIVAQAGPVLGKITNQELIEGGHSAKPTVRILLNNTPVGRYPIVDYPAALQHHVNQSEVRYQLILAAIRARPTKKILLTFNSTEHGEQLAAKLQQDLGERVLLSHGKHPDRKANLAAYKAGEARIMAISTIGREGLNIKDINVLIYGIGGKSVIWVKQFAGRLLRMGDDPDVEILDFWDVGQHVQAHSQQRIKIYKKEGFTLEYEYPATATGRPKQARIK